MRYIDIGGYVTPKKCIYGPRPAEGLVFNNYEWWSITDHLVKDQRERELAAISKAKEEAKKELSFQMTSNWSNTLASIKTQGNQKRLEKMNKEKQDKIDQYNQILKTRAEEKKAILSNVKEIMYHEKDDIRIIDSAVWFSTVIDGRRKQIEMKNMIKKEENQKEAERAAAIKKDAENFEKEKYDEKLTEKAKRLIQKKYLDEQIADIKKRRGEEERELEEEKKDFINMKIEGEKIHHCNMVEKEYRKNFAKKYMRKTDAQIEFERNLALEEEEEDEINKIYKNYSRKFKKERQEREEKMREEQVDRRMKIAEMLGAKLAAAAAKEEDSFQAALKEKEELARKEEEEKKEKQRVAVEIILDEKKKMDETQAKKMKEGKEEKKWEVLQNFRSAESIQEYRKSEKKRIKDEFMQLKSFYDRQCQENEERRAKELEEWLAPLEDDSEEKEKLVKYIEDTMNYVKENNLDEYPLRVAIARVKKLNGIEDKEAQQLEQIRKQKESEQQGTRKTRHLGNGCYCLKW